MLQTTTRRSTLVRAQDTDPYRVLGVSRAATKAEIHQAYRKLAVKFHPDKNHGERGKGAAGAFKCVGIAYAILRDDDDRAQYDMTCCDGTGRSPIFEDFARKFQRLPPRGDGDSESSDEDEDEASATPSAKEAERIEYAEYAVHILSELPGDKAEAAAAGARRTIKGAEDALKQLGPWNQRTRDVFSVLTSSLYQNCVMRPQDYDKALMYAELSAAASVRFVDVNDTEDVADAAKRCDTYAELLVSEARRSDSEEAIRNAVRVLHVAHLLHMRAEPSNSVLHHLVTVAQLRFPSSKGIAMLECALNNRAILKSIMTDSGVVIPPNPRKAGAEPAGLLVVKCGDGHVCVERNDATTAHCESCQQLCGDRHWYCSDCTTVLCESCATQDSPTMYSEFHSYLVGLLWISGKTQRALHWALPALSTPATHVNIEAVFMLAVVAAAGGRELGGGKARAIALLKNWCESPALGESVRKKFHDVELGEVRNRIQAVRMSIMADRAARPNTSANVPRCAHERCAETDRLEEARKPKKNKKMDKRPEQQVPEVEHMIEEDEQKPKSPKQDESELGKWITNETKKTFGFTSHEKFRRKCRDPFDHLREFDGETMKNRLIEARECACCGKSDGKLHRCKRCKRTWYCCKEHQIAHWQAGKHNCTYECIVGVKKTINFTDKQGGTQWLEMRGPQLLWGDESGVLTGPFMWDWSIHELSGIGADGDWWFSQPDHIGARMLEEAWVLDKAGKELDRLVERKADLESQLARTDPRNPRAQEIQDELDGVDQKIKFLHSNQNA